MASLFTAGDEEKFKAVYRKLMAIRIYKRAQTVGDISEDEAAQAVERGATTPDEIEAIYRLTSLAGFDERFVIPPFSREAAIELVHLTHTPAEAGGMGLSDQPERGL